jgi:DNA-binding MarR family transcriptional regulator
MLAGRQVVKDEPMTMTTTTVEADALSQLSASLRRITRRIDRQVSVGGLTSTEVSVLASITGRGPLGLGDLAAHEGINPTMLSRVIGKLEAADLVRRQSSIADRRAIEVVATRKGARMRERLQAERSRLLAERLAELPPEMASLIVTAAPALESLAAALQPH